MKVIAPRSVARAAVQIVNREAAVELRGIERLGKGGLIKVLGSRGVELFICGRSKLYRRVSITLAVFTDFSPLTEINSSGVLYCSPSLERYHIQGFNLFSLPQFR